MMTAERLADAPVKEAVTDYDPSCWRCGRVIAEYASRPWSIRCRRCKAENRSASCTNDVRIVD